MNVIGWSLVTPLGARVDAVIDRLRAGERAAVDNPHFDAATYGCRLAAPIAEPAPRTPHDRVLRRMGRFAYRCAREALEMSGVETGPRLGLFSGVGGLRAHWNDMLPALADQLPSFDGAWERGLRKLHPFWMLQHLSNNAHALLSADIDARGEGATYGGATAGAQALAAAIWALEARAIDAALVVAHDSLIEPETIVEMSARGAATSASLETLVAPYEPGAAGFVPGEAAAAVVLARDAGDPLAAASAAAIADGRTGAPDPETLGAAMTAAGIDDTAAVIDGAALGDPAFDAAERRWVPPGADFTAIQSQTGQLGAAASLVQLILLSAQLPPRSSAGALSAGAPGLAAAVHIQRSTS